MKSKLYLILISALACSFTNALANNSWASKANMPALAATRNGAAGFAIGDKGYVGTGYSNKKDFWEYNTLTDTWTQKADFGGIGRMYAVGFSIDSLGYLGTGYYGNELSDFWAYSPSTNSWTQKTNFAGGTRSEAVGFSIGHKGYIGTGVDNSTAYNDFYEYDPVANSWTQRANFGGAVRIAAAGFSVGSKGYIGTGRSTSFGSYQDFYEYNPTSNTWLQRANFGGTARSEGVGFSVGNIGYMGTGYNSSTYFQDLWAFNPAINNWSQMTNYVNTVARAVCFATCTKGYIGTGYTGGNSFNNLAEYTPINPPSAGFTASQTTFCQNTCINFTDTSNNAPTSWSWSFPGAATTSSIAQNPTNICYQTAGTFTVTLTATGGNCALQATKTITVNAVPVPNPQSNSPQCVGGTLNLTSTGGGTYSWIGPNNFTSNLQNPSRANLTSAMAGIYTVTVTGTNGCTATATTTVVVNQPPIAQAGNNGSLCEGETLLLNASGGTSYSWTGPGNFTSTLQNPARPSMLVAWGGTYTVVVTGSNGCTAPVTTTVVVNARPTATAGNNGALCEGATLDLTSGGGTSYSWTGPSTFTSSTQNPSRTNVTLAMSGTYTVIVTDANGCKDTATTNVQVNQNPIAQAASNSPICSGETLILTSSGGGTYSWAGPGGFISTNQNPSFIVADSIIGTGTYTVSVVAANGCSAIDTTNVIVHQTPSLTLTSNSPLCDSLTLNLFANFVRGTSYSWSGPNSFSSTFQSPSILSATLVNGGWYYCTITGTNGCNQTDSLLFVIDTVPHATLTPSGATTFCDGDSVSLIATSGTSYLWMPNGDTTQSIIATATGTYYCAVTDPNGCAGNATTPPIGVNVNPNPAIPIITVGDPTLSCSVSGSSYAWYLYGILTTYNTIVISPTSGQNGSWYVVVTNQFGCSTASDSVQSSVGIRTILNAKSFSVYPDPNNGVFTIEVNKESNFNHSFTIFDAIGQLIYEQTDTTENKFEIDLSGQAKGVYFLQVNIKNEVTTQKIIIQ